jgi:DNA-binding transcriptional LysR family regulator
MRVESLEYFMTIADVLNFLDASVDLNISQSSLSKAIIGLEKELGVKLLDRRHYPVTLTKAGRCLYEDLKELAPGYWKMLLHMRSFNKPCTVSCTVVPSSTILGLTYVFDEFAQINKGVLHISEQKDPALAIVDLQKGDRDFCIIHKPFIPKPELKIAVLKDDPLYVLLPADHPLSSSPMVSLLSLNNETFLVSPWSYTILRDLSETIIQLPPHIEKNIIRPNIINSISFGKGVAVYYESDIIPFKTNNITLRPVKEMPSNPLVLATSVYSDMTASRKKFWDFMVSVFSDFCYHKQERNIRGGGGGGINR